MNKSHHVSTVIPVKKTAFASKWFINSMSYEKSSIRLQWRDFCNLYIVYYEGIIVTYTSKGLFLQWRDYCNL